MARQQPQDSLQSINDQLRGQAQVENGPWLPLESNPEVCAAQRHAPDMNYIPTE